MEKIGFKQPPAQWFQQELDHFNAQDQRVWLQRFYVNDTFFNADIGGPIFFQVGGEGAISPGYVVNLMMAQYAQQQGALMVALEHRFYGQSHPFPDLSTENLAYLSSQQALADASVFISKLKEQYPTAGDVITFGGSYPGSLAAWFRLKYPHITKGSVASSAPVLAVLDMIQYLDVVDESLTKIAGIECDANVKLATAQVQVMLQSQSGRTSLENTFKTCSPIVTPLDVATFMSNLMGNWMGVVQYNNEVPGSPTIRDICDVMESNTSSVFQRYVQVANMFLSQDSPCLQVSYVQMVQQLQNVSSFGPYVGDRQWTYQTCAEFGYFQSTDSDNQPFGNLVPLSYYTQICKDVFGFDWLPRINETNWHYGGKHPQGTNVVFVNGSLDPWHALSVTESLSDTLTAIYIDGTAHCANMRPAKPTDPPGLAIAQKQIAYVINQFLSQ